MTAEDLQNIETICTLPDVVRDGRTFNEMATELLVGIIINKIMRHLQGLYYSEDDVLLSLRAAKPAIRKKVYKQLYNQLIYFELYEFITKFVKVWRKI